MVIGYTPIIPQKGNYSKQNITNSGLSSHGQRPWDFPAVLYKPYFPQIVYHHLEVLRKQMDNTAKRKYRVDPIYLSAFYFCAPKELVDRNDVVVCIEYKLCTNSQTNEIIAEYWVWCHLKADTTAKMVHHEVLPFGRLCGMSVAVESSLLNGVLQSSEAVRAIQKFAGIWPKSEV